MRRSLVGEKFGRLFVVEPSDDVIRPDGRARARYLCRCECGNEKIVYAESLTGGRTQSCGCLQKESASRMNMTHGDTNSKLYNVWSAIKRRCFNKSVPEYCLYGGRGITICDEWSNNYQAFKEWALSNGYDMNVERGKCTIDRIDVNGNYEPGNCRWVNQRTQMNNVSYNHILEYNGERHTIAEWADKYNMPYDRLLQRINKYGYSVEDALTKPPRHKVINK